MADPHVRIQGAGPVGILASLFLLRNGWSPESIELVDPAINSPIPVHRDDPRILALSHGTLIRLQQLGVDAQVTRIKHIHVSAADHFGSMEIKTDRVGVTDLGGLASYSSLLTTLREHCQRAGLTIQPQAEPQRDPAIRVVAEGGLFHPDNRSTNDGMSVVRDYGQQAVIGWVTTEQKPSDTAWERFTDDGAVALLPINDRYALIWCCAESRANALQSSISQERCERLQEVLGQRLTGITGVDITGVYPLGLKWRETLAEGNTVWIGNAAQALHPIAGQGMNLGFRDAETLANCLVQRGSAIESRLQDYAHRRRTDRWSVRLATDTLARQAWVRRAIGGVSVIPGAKKLLGQVLMYGG